MCKNWRGITLLSVLSKVFTHIVLTDRNEHWIKSYATNKLVFGKTNHALTILLH